MKKFLVSFFKIVALLVIVLVVLDFSYTAIYNNSNVRNKVDYVVNNPNQEYDVVVLGSSRANNHFATFLFAEKGLKAYNYGMSGSRLQESALLLDLMLERNFKIKNVILEVDLNIRSDGFSEGTRAIYMPYLYQVSKISTYYNDKMEDFNYLYYVPFYRYMKFDAKIGFRETCFKFIGKKSSSIAHGGYFPLLGKGKKLQYKIGNVPPLRNQSYENIKKICNEKGITLITVTTPICQNIDNKEYFNEVIKIYPEIKRYDSLIKEDMYYSSCGHMNNKGAELFTKKIIQDFFKMKIAFLTSEYPHEKTKGLGGIATSIKNLAAGLNSAGYKSTILVFSQDEDAVFDDEGVTVYKIKNIKFKGLSLFLTQKKIEKKINQLYAQQIIDVVEAPDWTGITSFIQPKKCPIVIRLHGSDTYFCDIEKRPSKFINRFLEKRALQKANAILSVSEYTANYTKKLFGLSKEITVIPNGVAVENFTKSNSEIIPNTILYFGTLIRKKGCLEIPDIFNKVYRSNPLAKLLLVGADSPDISTNSNSTWKLMEEKFNSEALTNVAYLGRKPYHEMRSIIEKANVCIFPSYAEALPVSWIEAMSLEKSIVASNIGWATELMSHEKEGFLIYPTDHEGWAGAINRILSDELLAKTLGLNARNKVEKNFTNEVIVEKNVSYYQKFSQ